MANGKIEGVLNHRDGSRKSKVHAMFNDKGPKVAMAWGLKNELKQNTLNSWFSQFRKETKILAKVKARKPRKARVAKVAAQAAA